MGEAKRDTKADEGIKEAEKLEVLILVDNYVDLLLPDRPPFCIRPPLSVGSNTFLAEHGLSLLISLEAEGKRYNVLFDTGYTETAIKNNMNMLGIDPKIIDAIVISHFHMDHTGGLRAILEGCKENIPIFVHPDAFIYPRYMKLPDGRKLIFPRTMIKGELEKRAKIFETRDPTLICDGFMLVSGQIERRSFEKGMPNLLLERDGKVEEDLILDDQALIISIKGKGLVIISGCAHSGVINTIEYARKITKTEKVYAVIGGFHLSGRFFEPFIKPTIEELKKIDPEVIVPMHCTGWNAIKGISEEFSSFILSSVGTRIIL